MEKNILQSIFFSSQKKRFMKKFYERFGNSTNVVTQEYWEKLFVSEELLPMKTFFHFFWLTLLSAGVQMTDDSKVKNLFWRKKVLYWKYFSLKGFDWFCMIHQWGYIRAKVKKNIFCKIVFLVSVSIKLFFTLLWVGVRNSEVRKEIFISAEHPLHRKLFSPKKLSKRL